MGIGAAIAGSAALGLVGSTISSHASQQAASQQAQAGNQASAQQLAMFNRVNQNLQPYNTIGQGALTDLNNIIAPLTTPFNGPTAFQPTQAQLEQTPGYQFDLSQGLESTQNSAAARGLGVSGAAMKAAANYATGLANNTLMSQDQIFNNNFTNSYNAYTGNQNNVYNKLIGMAGLGENAAATAGNMGLNAANASGGYLTSAANSGAAGTVGSANAISGGLSNLGSSGTNYLLMQNLLANGGNAGGLY